MYNFEHVYLFVRSSNITDVSIQHICRYLRRLLKLMTSYTCTASNNYAESEGVKKHACEILKKLPLSPLKS